jgi:hypothetical protein
MVSQGSYAQQDSHAEHSGNIPLTELSHQYSSRSLSRPDGDEDDEDDHFSVESFELYTPDEENSLLRKLDTHLVLFLAFLYMLSFLDRSSTSVHHPDVKTKN